MNTTEIDPGYLPADFATPGMQMLRDGQYREARRYYQTLTDARPNDAHGWFGLGSALLNEGKVRDAARAMLRGMTLAPEFPLGALLAETPALQPSVLFSITEIFVADKSEPARECALAALSRCLAHPCPPHNVFVRADSLRRRLCAAQVPQQDQTVQPVVELSRPSRNDRVVVGFARVVTFAVILFAAGFGSWCAYGFVQKGHLMREGMGHYRQALKATANHEDASLLYLQAFHEFDSLATTEPQDYKANYMVVNCGQDIIGRLHSGQVRLSRLAVTEIKAAVARSQAALGALDPNGAQAREMEADSQIQSLHNHA